MWYKNTYNWVRLQDSKRVGIQNCSSFSFHDVDPGPYRLPKYSFPFIHTSNSFHLLVKDGRYSYWLLAGRSGDRIPVRVRFFEHVQTGPGAHPTSCTMGTGSFPGVKWPGRGADHPPVLAPRSRKGRAIPLSSAFFSEGRRGTRTPKNFVNLTEESKKFKMLEFPLNQLQTYYGYLCDLLSFM
jgi:hypothetical protein